MKPPRLKDDCFALPPGVHWTPVDEALALLKRNLSVVVGTEILPVEQASGRITAASISAKRANPPTANSAVDGYGLAFESLTGSATSLPLVEGRSSAGGAFSEAVPPSMAIRILTGATLPKGVDTIVMQEDVDVRGGAIHFEPGLKKAANARKAGEDVQAADILFPVGHRLAPQDIALIVATGCGEIEVFKQLRVGVLSTGDEILPAGSQASTDQIFDANRPMLLAMLARWGFLPVDLGHVSDDRVALRASLNSAAKQVDAILTSGGASAGDEDHLSAILTDEGQLQSWRIALKPGRPLALGMWSGVPIFGLPGNPVAAFVCTLIFAKPALGQLAGASWSGPRAYTLPADFTKSKKAGRREYLRARINKTGAVEVFHSEGSGRISGLSWADGLVELSDEAQEIHPGDPVRYFPFESFAL